MNNLEKDNITNDNYITNFINEGDFIIIEFFSPRYNQRVTRLFEVETCVSDRARLVNAHMSFLICDNEFLEKQYDPIIKSIIPRERLNEIEEKYPIDQHVKKLVMNPNKKDQ